MADIQSATAEIRPGKNKKKKNHRTKIYRRGKQTETNHKAKI